VYVIAGDIVHEDDLAPKKPGWGVAEATPMAMATTQMAKFQNF
jgi:hypothetical protein